MTSKVKKAIPIGFQSTSMTLKNIQCIRKRNGNQANNLHFRSVVFCLKHTMHCSLYF